MLLWLILAADARCTRMPPLLQPMMLHATIPPLLPSHKRTPDHPDGAAGAVEEEGGEGDCGGWQDREQWSRVTSHADVEHDTMLLLLELPLCPATVA
jgi:hypothetical protein